jgi:5-methyltetrahydrofolate--homocysteine methyltransferase
VKRAKENYQISITDLGGVLDILSSFLGPTNLLLTMKRKPHIIDTCREIILEKLIKIYDKLYEIIKKDCKGFNAWLNVWCRKSWYPVQCDFIAMLNPKWFKRFALPDIITQIEHMDYAIYHMDGPYQIPFLDDFLLISHLTGIQWVPGAGRQPQGSEEWIPLYKKIQKAGKNVVIDTLSEKVPHLYRNLEHKGLYVRTLYSSKIIADFYLPPFIGGGDGKLIEEAISWVKNNEYSNLNRELLEDFLNTKQYEFDNGVKRQLLKQINSSLKEKLYFT